MANTTHEARWSFMMHLRSFEPRTGGRARVPRVRPVRPNAQAANGAPSSGERCQDRRSVEGRVLDGLGAPVVVDAQLGLLPQVAREDQATENRRRVKAAVGELAL